jgi:hypothetical protein
MSMYIDVICAVCGNKSKKGNLVDEYLASDINGNIMNFTIYSEGDGKLVFKCNKCEQEICINCNDK